MTILGLYTRKNKEQHHLVIFSCECIKKTTKNTKNACSWCLTKMSSDMYTWLKLRLHFATGWYNRLAQSSSSLYHWRHTSKVACPRWHWHIGPLHVQCCYLHSDNVGCRHWDNAEEVIIGSTSIQCYWPNAAFSTLGLCFSNIGPLPFRWSLVRFWTLECSGCDNEIGSVAARDERESTGNSRAGQCWTCHFLVDSPIYTQGTCKHRVWVGLLNFAQYASTAIAQHWRPDLDTR